jgi:hypothetical protein
VHYIVPAGALMPNSKWKHSRNRGKYLFKVEQLSNVFRARFVEQLRLLVCNKQVKGQVPTDLFEKDWVVYAKQPFGGPKQVINYLGRYTHRTAISNDRILEVNDSEVTFTWKDYSNNYKKQVTALAGDDFLRLFCQHILPPGFTRIRHYGFLSSAAKVKALDLIRKAIGTAPPVINTSRPWQEVALERMGVKPLVCKTCGGKMQTVQTLPNRFRQRQRAPPNKESFNNAFTS